MWQSDWCQQHNTQYPNIVIIFINDKKITQTDTFNYLIKQLAEVFVTSYK